MFQSMHGPLVVSRRRFYPHHRPRRRPRPWARRLGPLATLEPSQALLWSGFACTLYRLFRPLPGIDTGRIVQKRGDLVFRLPTAD